MTKPPRRPHFPDVQPPKVYRAGATLRRGFPLGPAETREEQRLRALLQDGDAGPSEDGESVTLFQPGGPPKR